MLIEKQELIKKVENIIEKMPKTISILIKDLTDIIMFLSIYGGGEQALSQEINILMKGLETPKVETSKFTKIGDEKKVEKQGTKAVSYSISSYDKTQTLNLIFSKLYLKIEKAFADETNYYLCEYVFNKEGEFVRKCEQKSCPLGKQLEFEEKSEGIIPLGVCFSKIKEKTDQTTIDFFKLLTTKGEEIYYSYVSPPDIKLNCKAPAVVKSIPSINSLGMKELSELLSLQFSKKLVSIDQRLFSELKESAKAIFEAKKNKA